MILAIVFAVLAYQKAKASGRNSWLWVFIAIAVYIGVQLLAGLAIGVVLAIGIGIFDWPESVITTYEIVINIVAIVGAIVASWLLLKYLDRIPDEQPMSMPPPPPPPTFRTNSQQHRRPNDRISCAGIDDNLDFKFMPL